MESYPWWTEEQKAFAVEVEAFAEELMPIDAETRWKRQFPWEIFRRISKKGYTGAGVPKEYGGLGRVEPDARAGQGVCGQHAGWIASDYRVRDR